MAIDPATAKAIADAAQKVLTDEETRKKLIYGLIIGIAILIIIIAIPVYLLTHPVEAIKLAIGGGESLGISDIEKFKSENDTAIVNFGTNILWNENAKYPMPLNGNILKKYGEQSDSTIHSGIDIACGVENAEVTAIADGLAVEVSTDKDGNTILIQHTDPNGSVFYSFYANLSKINIIQGQSIYQKMVIGNMGDSTQHLHFEIRTESSTIDPVLYFTASSDTTESENSE